MRKKLEPIPWYMKPVNPSPVVTSIILAGGVAVAYNVMIAAGRWYDRVIPGIAERVELAKITADTVLGDDDED